MLTLSLLLGVRTGTVPALFYQGILTSRKTIVKRYFKIFCVAVISLPSPKSAASLTQNLALYFELC